eukprot:gene8242-830_t
MASIQRILPSITKLHGETFPALFNLQDTNSQPHLSEQQMIVDVTRANSTTPSSPTCRWPVPQSDSSANALHSQSSSATLSKQLNDYRQRGRQSQQHIANAGSDFHFASNDSLAGELRYKRTKNGSIAEALASFGSEFLNYFDVPESLSLDQEDSRPSKTDELGSSGIHLQKDSHRTQYEQISHAPTNDNTSSSRCPSSQASLGKVLAQNALGYQDDPDQARNVSFFLGEEDDDVGGFSALSDNSTSAIGSFSALPQFTYTSSNSHRSCLDVTNLQPSNGTFLANEIEDLFAIDTMLPKIPSDARLLDDLSLMLSSNVLKKKFDPQALLSISDCREDDFSSPHPSFQNFISHDVHDIYLDVDMSRNEPSPTSHCLHSTEPSYSTSIAPESAVHLDTELPVAFLYDELNQSNGRKSTLEDSDAVSVVSSTTTTDSFTPRRTREQRLKYWQTLNRRRNELQGQLAVANETFSAASELLYKLWMNQDLFRPSI